MTHDSSLIQPFITPTLAKRALVGGASGLALMILFLSGVKHPQPEWGQYWMIRPLIVITLAGIAGATCYHILDTWREKFYWNKAVVVIGSLLIYLIGLWMGTVLGLVGTLWH